MSMSVVRMRSNGFAEAKFCLLYGQFFAAVAVVHIVGSGKQNGP